MNNIKKSLYSVINLDSISVIPLIVRLYNINISPSDEPEEYCKQIKELCELLPENIKSELNKFITYGNKRGFLLFKYNSFKYNTIAKNNESICDTPPNNNCKVGEKIILARLQSVLVSYISNIVSYEAEGYGRIFQDIVPDIKMANQQSSVGSSKELEIHTEQAFSKIKPDLLSLACIRGDDHAYTYILPVQSIISNLNEKERELLRQPLWKIGVDYSFKLNGNEFIEGNIRGPIPIITGSEENPTLVFDQDLMIGINEDATQIIKKIVDIYYNNRIKHCLQPGEIMIIDNHKVVHGRSPFVPLYNGKDRFLVRCFGMFEENFKNSSYARNDGKIMFNAIYS
jgi:L-asparagine oxygenase